MIVEVSNCIERHRIDYLKAFASILVVLHHSLAYYNLLTNNAGGGIGYVIILCHSVNVSLFVIIAGYLCHEQPVKSFYSKKLRRIFIPFVTFSFLKIIYTMLISTEFSHGLNLGEQLFKSIFFGDQYWFAYAILFLFMIAPLVWKCSTDNPIRWVLSLLFLLIMLSVYDIKQLNFLPNLFQFNNAIHYLWFFIVGYMLKNVIVGQKNCISYLKARYSVILLLTTTVIFVYSVLYFEYGMNFYQFPIKPILGLSLATLLYILSSCVPKDSRLLLTISKYSLQIMFFDAFFRVLLFKFLSMFGIMNIGMAILSCVFNVAMTLLSCILIEKIKYIRVLFGL